jgi:hypothetical protein
LSVTRIEPRKNRGYHLGRHSTGPEQLHVDKVAPEKNEVGVEGSGFSNDALEARNILGMGAGMKIGQKKYSEGMRPPRPTIDYEPQSANQMRTRPSNALKATFSAELVAKGGPRNDTDQTIPQNLPKRISIQAIVSIRQRFGAHPSLDTEVATNARLSGIAVQHIWKHQPAGYDFTKVSNFGRQLTRSHHQALNFSGEAFVLEKEERMASGVDTGTVFKHPVHCFGCDQAFYFTLRKIAEAKKLACPLCGSDINLTHEAYGFVVTSVKETIALIDQSSRDLQRTSIAPP